MLQHLFVKRANQNHDHKITPQHDLKSNLTIIISCVISALLALLNAV